VRYKTKTRRWVFRTR